MQVVKAKSIKVLALLVLAVFILSLCFLLVIDVKKDISKSYEGIYVGEDSEHGQKITAIVDGTITYESVFSKEIKSFFLDVTLKDSTGNSVLDACARLDTINGEFIFSSGIVPLYIFNEEENDVEQIATISMSDDFEQILLKFDDDTYYAAPAVDLETAKQILNKQ